MLLAGLPAAHIIVASRLEMTSFYDRWMDRLAGEFSTPMDEWNSNVSDLAQSSADRPWSSYRYCIAELFAAPLNGAPRLAEYLRGRRDGLRIGIALELYHREHGTWPPSLEWLARRWLASMPADRITGEMPRYRVEGDRPVVYSVGVDRDDDGGRLPVGPFRIPHAVFAGPAFWSATLVVDPQHDGDWVIWSTVMSREQGARIRE
jgi:hypothetical protein